MTAPDTLVPVPAEPTTPIRPSEALRLGRLRYPVRLTGELFDGETGACALGSILAGSGGDHSQGYGDLHGRFPQLSRPSGCPLGDCRLAGWAAPKDGADVVYHLNDYHDWSDVQIAGYLIGLGL